MQTVVLNGLYFPFVDLLSSVALAVVLGYGGHLYFDGTLTLGTLFAFMLYVQNFFDPGAAAVAALQHVPLGDGRARQDHGRPRRGAGGRRPAGRASSCRGSRVTSRFEDVRFTYGRGDEVLHGIDLDVPAGHDRRARRAHGRRQVDDREAARALLRADARADHDRRRST